MKLECIPLPYSFVDMEARGTANQTPQTGPAVQVPSTGERGRQHDVLAATAGKGLTARPTPWQDFSGPEGLPAQSASAPSAPNPPIHSQRVHHAWHCPKKGWPQRAWPFAAKQRCPLGAARYLDTALIILLRSSFYGGQSCAPSRDWPTGQHFLRTVAHTVCAPFTSLFMPVLPCPVI